ncbi:MAG: tol-pal system-associated acyl-CoA thioesterase [Betaproteobacteria bacterium]|jgi:acyl-CoA thioester hydrolase
MQRLRGDPHADFRADFSWPLRVYYEDTDAGGIVYYANFLKFFERCRTEWLRVLGFDQARLAAQERLQFVVTELAVRYLKPARLDDRLDVSARLVRVGAASLHFEQQLVRDGELLAAGQVKVACVSAETLAPAAMPAGLRRALAASGPAPKSR